MAGGKIRILSSSGFPLSLRVHRRPCTTDTSADIHMVMGVQVLQPTDSTLGSWLVNHQAVGATIQPSQNKSSNRHWKRISIWFPEMWGEGGFIYFLVRQKSWSRSLSTGVSSSCSSLNKKLGGRKFQKCAQKGIMQDNIVGRCSTGSG